LHHFDLKDGALHAEGVPLELIADEVGTPAYVYSTATLKRHYGLLRAAADAHRDALGEALIAFAVKANSNIAILNLFARLGAGFDIV
jgi:diaminopimelate decarboxylase